MTKKLTSKQIGILKGAEEWCDAEDKSTEFMIQYMQDMANCSHDQLMDFLEKTWSEQDNK